MKVAILTFVNADNWGAVLQAYALQQKVDSMGYTSDQVYVKTNRKKNLGKNPVNYAKYMLKNLRRKRFKKFKDDNINIKEFSNLQQINALYDCFITGSDQIFNCTNGVSPMFYLQFVQNKPKIAYAASFGISQIPDKYKEEIITSLTSFDSLSVREKTGQDIIKNLINKTTYNVCDPVMLLSKAQWEEKAGEKRYIKGKYIFVYATQTSQLLFDMCEHLRAKTKLPVISTFNKNGYKFKPNIGPAEFLNCIKNAEYVVCTSFHATAFSIIFGKPFFVVPHTITGSRVTDLLSALNLESRIVSKENYKNIAFNMNYTEAEKKLNEFKNISMDYLINALNNAENKLILQKQEKSKLNVRPCYLDTLNKDLCYSCGVCKLVCPKNCIEMIEDEWGIPYPKIDIEKCINCNKCRNVCKKPIDNKSYPGKKYYICVNKNSKVVLKSASGGAFSAIQQAFCTGKYLIVGAAYDKDMNVIQTCVDSMDKANIFHKSKYVFSNPIYSFKEVQDALNNNIKVLYSGTPCQIAALKKYLGREYDNLLTIDIICDAVSKPSLFKKYLNSFDNQITNYDFRYKKKYQGKIWSGFVKIYTPKKDIVIYKDVFKQAYLEGLIPKESCLQCQYSNLDRNADITIGDFGRDKYLEKSSVNYKNGASIFIVNTLAGEKIKQNMLNYAEFEEVSEYIAIKKQPRLYKKMEPNKNYNNFINQLHEGTDINIALHKYIKIPSKGQQLVAKFIPDKLKLAIKRRIRH